MLGAAEITNAALQPFAQLQEEQVQLLGETDLRIGQAIESAQTAVQWQASLMKQLLTFEGNAVTQLLQPLAQGLGQNVDFRV